MPITPKFNDAAWDLWWAIANNWYEIAINQGLTGFTPPNWNDKIYDLEKKTAYYSARMADISP